MSRPRTVQPRLFTHEGLFDAEHETGLPLRLAFIGLFTVCDREGRFEWRPRTLKTFVLPFDEVDFEDVLDALLTRGYVVKYEASNGDLLGWIPRFRYHQQINPKEAASKIEAPSNDVINQALTDACRTRETHEQHAISLRQRRERHESRADTRTAAHVYARETVLKNQKHKTNTAKTAKTAKTANTAMRAREEPNIETAEKPPTSEAPAVSEMAEVPPASDVLDAGGAGKLAGALRYAGFAATPSHPKVREAAIRGVTEATLALAIPHAIAEKQGNRPTAAFVLAVAERMHAEGLDVPGDNAQPIPLRTQPVANGGLRYPLTPAQEYLAKRKAVHDGLCVDHSATGPPEHGGFDDGLTVDVDATELRNHELAKIQHS